jgi:class 3 adenylate cyclase/tetratricopeptide (TPR) repeat protein
VCGLPLGLVCGACGTAAVRAEQRFCDQCGEVLSVDGTGAPGGRVDSLAVHAARDSTQDSTQPVSERRVCSVLFCDLVEFTPFSETRDPEEVREFLSRYFDIARTIVGRYGGAIEKFIGDAVMAVWGTPVAREEDAERAVRAGMDLVSAIDALGQEVGAPGLAARAGVVTGMVAVNVGASGEGMVAGDAVNTAARVQAAAPPGMVLVDEGTRRVADAAIGFTPAGEQQLKGKSQPVSLWSADQVLAGVGGSQRIDGLEARFVGRDAELRLVKELFHACAQRRSPRLVSISGAAGVGKSRLGWEFEKYVDGLADTVWWHRGRCLPYGDGVAFWALAEMVRQRLQIAEEDPTAIAADKLAAGLDGWGGNDAERSLVHESLAQLLGVEYGGTERMLARDELFAGWRLFFERLAETSPVVMIVEDLHHADAGMLDFIEHLLEWARDVPAFVVTLTRPELEDRRPGWGAGHRNSTTLTLDALDDPAMGTLVASLVPGMPAAARTAIEQRAEGIPLYAVETVRMLIDRDLVQPIDGAYRFVGDVGAVGALSVPATLQSLLAARLDSLAPEVRKLVADAAVLGGTFSAEALVGVSGESQERVRDVLAELVRREVLAVRSDPLSPQRGHYGFVQTMFRQVAYDTLSRRERKSRHLAVAAHLRSAFADGGEGVAEVIAAHLLDALNAVPDDPDVARIRDEAVEMLIRAGDRAARTGAPAASASAYTTAADLLERITTAEAELRAAGIWERAGIVATWDDAAAAVGHFRRAADLHRRHGQVREAARVQTGLGNALHRLGRIDDARTALRRALESLEVDPQADTVDALTALSRIEAFSGNVAEADRLSSAALARAQALDLSDFVLAELFTNRGLAHIFGNRPAQATASYREAIRRADAAHATETSWRAQSNLAELLLNTDPAASMEASLVGIAMARRLGNRFGAAWGLANAVQALLLTGGWDEAEALYEDAVRDDALDNDWLLAYGIALMRALRGDRAGVSELLPSLDASADSEDVQTAALVTTSLAAAAACVGDHAECLSRAERSLDHADALGLASEAIRWAWPMAADAAIALDDRDTAIALLSSLDEHPIGHVPAVLRAEGLRVRARLLDLDGNADAATTYEQATLAFRQFGSPYHLAVGLLDQAAYLAASDPATAQSLASEAAVIAEGLRSDPLLQRAAMLVEPAQAGSSATHV